MKPVGSLSAWRPATVLTVAGSDSGGAAGLQADLRTFARLAVYGLTVVTAVTAQNSLEVAAVQPIPVELITAQMRVVLGDYGALAAKTGFIGRAEAVVAVAEVFSALRPPFLVVDPVLVNHRGETMFPAEVSDAYRRHLIPLADLVTPNPEEATLLTGIPVTDLSAAKAAAQVLIELGAQWVLVKGFKQEDEMVDLLTNGLTTRELRAPYLATENTHGSGDTLSAAVCAFLTQDHTMPEAVHLAHAFTAAAIRGAVDWRLASGHGPVNQWAAEL